MFGFDSSVEYRDIPGCDGYRAGSDGTIWSCWKKGGSISINGRRAPAPPQKTTVWKQVAPANSNRGGYLRLKVKRDNGQVISALVHRLVLEAFVGPCPDGMQCRHFPDQNPANCRLENISWATPKENAGDKEINGTVSRGSNSGRTRLTESQIVEIRTLFSNGESVDVIAALYSLKPKGVEAIVYRRRWKHVGGPDGVTHHLTRDQVMRIRSMFNEGKKRKAIANETGVAYLTVCGVIRGTYYSDVH